MVKYRNRLQIVAEILKIVSSKAARKTHIMYKANLSYQLLCKYLNEVLECGFVQIDRNDCYVASPKGKRFLQRFDAYRKRREHVNQELSVMSQERAFLERMYSESKTDKARQKPDVTGKIFDH